MTDAEIESIIGKLEIDDMEKWKDRLVVFSNKSLNRLHPLRSDIVDAVQRLTYPEIICSIDNCNSNEWETVKWASTINSYGIPSIFKYLIAKDFKGWFVEESKDIYKKVSVNQENSFHLNKDKYLIWDDRLVSIYNRKLDTYDTLCTTDGGHGSALVGYVSQTQKLFYFVRMFADSWTYSVVEIDVTHGRSEALTNQKKILEYPGGDFPDLLLDGGLLFVLRIFTKDYEAYGVTDTVTNEELEIWDLRKLPYTRRYCTKT